MLTDEIKRKIEDYLLDKSDENPGSFVHDSDMEEAVNYAWFIMNREVLRMCFMIR